MSVPVLTLVGGPTALIEGGGFRLLTNSTFDAPGEYKLRMSRPHHLSKREADRTQ